MREAVIVSAVRTAVGKAPRGTLKDTRPDEMATVVYLVFLVSKLFILLEEPVYIDQVDRVDQVDL